MKKMLLPALLVMLGGSMYAVNSPTGLSATQKRAEAMEKAHQRITEGKGISLQLPAEVMPQSPKGNSGSNNQLPSGKLIPSAESIRHPKSQASARQKAADRLHWMGMDLYGYISYEWIANFVPGMFEFNDYGGYDFMWADPILADLEEGQAMNGWLKDGKYQGIQSHYVPGTIYAYYWYSIDFETGNLLEFEDYFGQTSFVFLQCAYNPDNDRVYGFGHDFHNTETPLFWASAPADDLTDYEFIAPVSNLISFNPEVNNMAYGLCYNPSDGYFYAVTVLGELVRIHEDGSQEHLMTIMGDGFSFTTLTGIVWSPELNCLVWAPYFGNNTSALMLLDYNKGTQEEIDYFQTGPEFTTLLTTTEVPSNPDKPLRAEINSINFSEGNLTGTVNFTMPTRFANGNTIPAGAVLSYTALLDGEAYATGNAETGAKIEVEYTVNSTGYHTLGIYTSYKDIESFATDKKIWIGNDTPFPPTNVELTRTLVSWEPVGNVGIHGGYVNPAEVVYSVWINNVEEGSTQGTSYPVELDSEEMTAFFATVFAEFDGETSKAGRSNKIITGEAFTVPMILQPTQAEFNLMTVVDANGDGVTWTYYADRHCLDSRATDSSVSSLDMDDYIFLPAVEITDTNCLYEFSLDAVISDNAVDYIEYLEVVWATEPDEEHIGGYIIDEFYPEGNVYYDQWTHEMGIWQVETPGIYYIGLHCTSPADQIGIYARNLSLTKSKVTVDAPATPYIRSVKSGHLGALYAEVTVQLPKKRYDGQPLPEDLEMTVHFIVNGEEVSETGTGLPGEEVTVTVPTEQGDNKVEAYLTAGDLQSPVSLPYEIYTGQTVPASTQYVNFEVAEDMLSATVSWAPVTTADVANGYVDPDEITYTVYMARTQGENAAWGIYRENVKGTSFEYTLPAFSEMAMYIFGVTAFNEAGSNGKIVSSQPDMMGRPYSLPFVETFDDPYEGIATTPWLTYTEYEGKYIKGTWVYTNLYELMEGPYEDHPAIIGFSLYNFDYGMMSMPRFSTKGIEHARISFPTVFNPLMAKLTLLGKVYGSDEYIEIGSVDAYSQDIYEDTVTFYLPDELMYREWVEINFLGDYQMGYTFTAIVSVEVEATEDGSVAGISRAGRIHAGKGVITLTDLEGEKVTIATLDGRQIVNSTVGSDNAAYNMAPGFYIVSAGATRAKVNVR